MHTRRWDTVILAVGGAVLWAVAALFLWRDLAVPPEAFLAVLSLGAAALAVKRLPDQWGWAGPAALLGAGALGATWFTLTSSLTLLPAMGIVFGATVVALLRSSVQHKGQRLLLWYGLAVSALAFSGAGYFHLFTVRLLADDVGRALILSFAWLGFGVALVTRGARSGESYPRDVGFATLFVAVSKVLVYDTTHLGGPLRVLVLVGGGALLWLGAVLANRQRGEAELGASS